MTLKKERCGQYGSSYLLNQFLLQSECTRQIYLLIYYNNRFVQNRTQSYITHTQTNKQTHQNELTLSTSHPNSSRKGKSFLYRLVMGLWMGRGKQQQQQQQQQCIRIEHTTTYYPRYTQSSPSCGEPVVHSSPPCIEQEHGEAHKQQSTHKHAHKYEDVVKRMYSSC